jgi:hypothetical protein
MLSQRNKAKRVGLVLSLIWFICFGLYFWSDVTQHSVEHYKQNYGLCYDNFNASDNLQSQSKEDDNSRSQDSFKQCKAQAWSTFMDEARSNERGIVILLATDFLTIAFAWLMAWAVIAAVRLKRR